MATLDADKQLVSDLWLDQPDAHDRIAAKLAAGAITDEEAQRLRQFTDDGFTQLSLDLDASFYDEFDADIDRLWRERPFEVAVASRGTRISFRDYEGERTLGHRLPDIHSYSHAARALYVDAQIFRMVELILDQPAIAFQSLYFEFPSQQDLHRDPMFVSTNPQAHLLATWAALEDITADRGPLLYAPGSHRMQWFEFNPDSVSLPSSIDEERRRAWRAHREEELERLGLAVEALTCQRGDVFFWHAGLLHGGQHVEDDTLTRKSFVVHYTSAAHYADRTTTMQVKSIEDGETVWRLTSGTTADRIEVGDRLGLESPLHHAQDPNAARTSRRSRPFRAR